MKTTSCPNLPRPPDILRAQCPEARPINYLSDYLWKFNRALNIYFPWMYYDMRYGRPYFDDDRTLDCGEMKYDATEHTINICGTDYTKTWSVPTVYVYHFASTAPFIQKRGEYRKDWELAWDDYDNDPSWRGGPTTGSATLRWGAWQIADGNYYNEVGGHQLALQFDTSATDPSPVTITLRLDVETVVSEDLGTPAVKLYRLDEVVDPETHWDYTDNYISETSISAAGNYDISLTESDINIGGTTRLLVKLSSTDVSQPTPADWSITEYNELLLDASFVDNIWLKFTY